MAVPDTKFGVSDASGELYVMEQLYDYKMVEDRSIVEQVLTVNSYIKVRL
jgi:hypothetical protein